MYFSVITPAPGCEREAAHDWAGGPYVEHQWLWQRFFRAPNGAPRDFLFRRWDAGEVIRFYAMSQRMPEPEDRMWRVQTRDYAPKLKVGMRLHFDLRANPTVAVRDEGKLRRHDVVMREKKRLLAEKGLVSWDVWQEPGKPNLYEILQRTCGAWLRSRAERSGFEVDSETLQVEAYQQHAHRKRSQQNDVQFSTVDFSGQMCVTDPETLGDVLRNGLGRAKAFGCGLLLIRPA